MSQCSKLQIVNNKINCLNLVGMKSTVIIIELFSLIILTTWIIKYVCRGLACYYSVKFMLLW